MPWMKTEVTEELHRRAKMEAARRGETLQLFMSLAMWNRIWEGERIEEQARAEAARSETGSLK